MGRARKIWGILLAAGVLYLVWLRLGGPGIPCPFHLATGLLCPGCGVTTMLVALSRLDFQGAFAANAFLLCTLPLLVFELVHEWRRCSAGRPQPRWNQVLLAVYGGGLLLFGILRNLPL